MATYIATAFSFLAANLGWFGGIPQTEVFFWAEIVCLIVCAVVGIVLMIVTGGVLEGVTGAVLGGLGSILGIVGIAVRFLLCMLAAWICTQLWGLDFYLAFQLLAIGSATGQLFKYEKSDD